VGRKIVRGNMSEGGECPTLDRSHLCRLWRLMTFLLTRHMLMKFVSAIVVSPLYGSRENGVSRGGVREAAPILSSLKDWKLLLPSEKPYNFHNHSCNYFCRAMLCISAAYAVAQCPSICLSVCRVRVFCRNK